MADCCVFKFMRFKSKACKSIMGLKNQTLQWSSTNNLAI